MYIDAPIVILK